MLSTPESQKRIYELLKTCALKNDLEASLPESHTWFAKLGKGMKSSIEKHRSPKRRDVVQVLMNCCKLDPETARKIADMVEMGDTETMDVNQDKQVGNKQGEGRPNPVVGGDENGFVIKNTMKPNALWNQPGTVKAEPHNALLEGEDKSGLVKKISAKHDALWNQHSSVEAEPHNDVLEGENKSGLVTKIVAKPDALQNQPGAELGLVDKGDAQISLLNYVHCGSRKD